MTRDELLDKLAMELGEWPSLREDPAGEYKLPSGWVFIVHRSQWAVTTPLRDSIIIGIDWLMRRTQLINKPSWEDAPEWAEWLAQDADGEWWWMEVEPRIRGHMWTMEDSRAAVRHACGATPNGHNWRDTLEQRPEEAYDEARMDAVGQNGGTGEHYDEVQDAVNALFALREAVREAGPIATDEPDPVNHPEHYQSDNGIECIDAIRAALGKEGFIAYCRGNALKYAFRSGRKQKHAEDLRKGAWYLERAAQALEE